MVFRVVPVIEKGEVVDRPIVARCSSRVLEIPVHMAKPEPEHDSWQIHRQKEERRQQHEDSPETGDDHCLGDYCRRPSNAGGHASMVRKMPIPPDTLRDSEQRREVESICPIGTAGSEERQVQEVMRDRVRVPPDSDGYKRDRWRQHQRNAMQQRQRHKVSIPV